MTQTQESPEPLQTEWQNWSGAYSCRPQSFKRPQTEDELADLVRTTNDRIRVAGAGHSFSQLVPTNQMLISLENMTGLIETNLEKNQATCWAGTRIKHLGQPMWDAGLSLPVQGDVDHQTIGGAVGTGTHGSGQKFGCMSTAVVGFRLLLADGSFLDCDAENNSEVFQAGRIAFGSLGIMTRLRLQCEPAFYLTKQTRTMPRTEAFANYQQWLTENRHFEFFSFPHCDRVFVQTQNIGDETIIKSSLNFDELIVKLFAESARFWPGFSRLLQRTAMRLIFPETTNNKAFQIYPSPRDIKFNEFEYAIPAEHFQACYDDLIDLVRSKNLNIAFPFECRWVAADDIWLSPFYERDCAVISVHRYVKQSHKEFFDLAEPIFWKYDGRPHWGKMHSLSAPELAKLFPRWSDFLDLRQQLDPSGKFLNDHLRTVFGI